MLYEGLSITEMEIRCAVLDRALQRRSFFYFRRPTVPVDAPPDVYGSLWTWQCRTASATSKHRSPPTGERSRQTIGLIGDVRAIAVMCIGMSSPRGGA